MGARRLLAEECIEHGASARTTGRPAAQCSGGGFKVAALTAPDEESELEWWIC